MKKTEKFIRILMLNVRAESRRRSAWCRGVAEYAMEIAEEIAENMRGGYIAIDDLCNRKLRERVMLNGAANWHEYSWGGCSLIYDRDIARRLCNPSELKKTQDGSKNPNSREQWLDTQARALYQAAQIVETALQNAYDEIAYQ